MTYELRTNGTHALTCDAVACANELISHAQDVLSADADLLGWQSRADGNKHRCPDCQRGINAAKTLLRTMHGSETPTIVAQFDVKVGDLIVDADGIPYATYTRDALEGEEVTIEALDLAELTAPVSAQYAEILGRTPMPDPDELFAGFDVKNVPAGYEMVSAGKASRSPQKAREPKAGSSPGRAVTAPPAGAQTPSKGRKKLSLIEMVDESHKLFDFLDERSSKTGWSSDDE